jgi:hypothetical protein
MEDADRFTSDDVARDKLGPGEPIKEASTAMDEEDAELVYDHTRFKRGKISYRYFHYYHRRRIIVEKGAIIEEFDERAPRVWAVLEAPGWIDMKDHRPTLEAIVWEFYVNLHQRCGDSFRTWLKGTTIEVTPTLIIAITKASRVCDPTYPYLVDHLPALSDLVMCFFEGRTHQMELDGEGSFQMSDFSNDVRCIYHILASRVLTVISHTLITIERAHCLYALLIEASINYGSLVTSTMMSV